MLWVAVTPNGQLVVSSSDDNTVKVWDLETGSEVRTFSGHTERVLWVAVTLNGQQLVSDSDDNNVKIRGS